MYSVCLHLLRYPTPDHTKIHIPWNRLSRPLNPNPKLQIPSPGPPRASRHSARSGLGHPGLSFNWETLQKASVSLSTVHPSMIVITDPSSWFAHPTSRDLRSRLQIPLRVQVLNNHIPAQNLHYNSITTTRIPSTEVLSGCTLDPVYPYVPLYTKTETWNL